MNTFANTQNELLRRRIRVSTTSRQTGAANKISMDWKTQLSASSNTPKNTHRTERKRRRKMHLFPPFNAGCIIVRAARSPLLIFFFLYFFSLFSKVDFRPRKRIREFEENQPSGKISLFSLSSRINKLISRQHPFR